MKKYKKVPLRGNRKIGTYPVYTESVYRGKEPFKIVGIRETEVELEGDFSGARNIIQKEWFNIDDCFLVQSVCEEQLKPNGCQVHNVHCCGGGDIQTSHIDKYWGNLINK